MKPVNEQKNKSNEDGVAVTTTQFESNSIKVWILRNDVFSAFETRWKKISEKHQQKCVRLNRQTETHSMSFDPSRRPLTKGRNIHLNLRYIYEHVWSMAWNAIFPLSDTEETEETEIKQIERFST